MIVISGGTLIDPASDIDGEADILIDDGKVLDIGKPGAFKEAQAEKIAANGKWIMPGLIDLHVHLREPGFEWKETIETGSQAAVLGGFTTVCCMPNTNPRNDNAEITRFIKEKAKAANCARILPIGAVSVGLEGKQMAPLAELRDAGCVAFSDDGEPVYDAGLMRRALEWCEMLGAVISCHEEDKCLSCGGAMNESGLSTRLGLKGWPSVAEEVMIARDIELARYTKGKAHICHVSTARGVELVRRAKNDGIQITCEVTPHHLTLSEDAVGEYDTNAKMSPPLRSREDVEGLIAGLKDGAVDAIASDHAPHELDSKRVEFSKAAFGILGLQTSLPLLIDFVHRNVLSRKALCALLTSGPARCFGLEFGRLRKGDAADLVIVDPGHRWTFSKEECRSISFNSPFLEKEMRGRAEQVFVAGRCVVKNGVLVAQE